MYAQEGTPAQDLPAMLPSQFVIQAVGSLFFTAPFIVLGAVIAGGDWGRGTIRTSLLACGPGPRLRRAGGGHLDRLRGQRAAVLRPGRAGLRRDPLVRRPRGARRGLQRRFPRLERDRRGRGGRAACRRRLRGAGDRAGHDLPQRGRRRRRGAGLVFPGG